MTLASARMTKRASRPRTGLQPIGERVRRLRIERNLSQDRLSLSANIDQSGFSKFERGARSLGEDAVRRIADVLRVSFEEMVKNTDFRQSPGSQTQEGLVLSSN